MTSADKITSPANTSVRRLLELREARRRRETGLFIVEGKREIELAIKRKVEIREVYVCREYLKEGLQTTLSLVSPKSLKILETSPRVFDKISFGERKEGLIGVGVARALKLDELPIGQGRAFLVILENVEKPGNLGAILRTCDGAGVDGLIVCDNQTDIYNPNVIRASLGTVFSVPVVCCSIGQAQEYLKEHRVRILIAVPDAKILYTQVDFQGAKAVVLGSEQKGLSEFWKKHHDESFHVPMKGAADSLNVSAAAAVIVYEAMRQRNALSAAPRSSAGKKK